MSAPPGKAPEAAPDEATARQWRAADPVASTWVEANAGSGKTRVLTDRVARLLLRGVPPERILCLTYTKAAAAEMQLRLFDRLGAWAMMPDAELLTALAALGAEVPDRTEALRAARRLFARAIDAPGGLRIQTIHAFCGALLRRFPLEARVPPGFREGPERGLTRLREDVLADMAEGEDRRHLDALARHHTGDDPGAFAVRAGALGAIAPRAALAALLEVPETLDAADLARIAFEPGDADLLRAAAAALAKGGKTDMGAAVRIAALRPEVADLPNWEAAFLWKSGENVGRAKTADVNDRPLGTKAVRADPAFPAAELDALMERIEAAAQARRALAALERTDALRGFAAAFARRFEAAKLRRGWLDFDDLLRRARDLLADPAVAPWVLWKLDGGIDHVLIDEAQDTAPVQWEIVAALLREMTAGQGADRPGRTLFVVGDPKQSIYRFQGADPAGFARTRDDLGARLEAAGHPVQDVPLLHSFRSAGAVLGAVDVMLDGAPEERQTEHLPFFADLPGRVDLWPSAPAPEKAEPAPWQDPVDRPAEDAAPIRLARAVVERVAEMIGTQAIPERSGDRVAMRAVRPGDVLILVRSRGTIFREIIRHAKALGLPVAGADRLRVAAELAVRDVTSLLAFLSLPEDDLSLAEALRSPLLGWSEADLYAAAQGRPPRRSLWEELRGREDEWPATLAILTDLRDRAGYLRPYELIERILDHHDGRRRLAARLGPEIAEGIDALLGLALTYEADEVPTLTGFVSWLRADGSEIKRVAEGAGGLIRVMTVHGAKGLEAPIVILPQAGPVRGTPAQVPDLLETPAGIVWKPRKEDMPAPLAPAVDAEKARMAAEQVRLLYVAMTRARSWLIVAGAGDMGADGTSWHARVEAALGGLRAAPLETPFGPGLRHQAGDWAAPAPEAPEAPPAPAPLPDWIGRHPPPAAEDPAPRKPSDLGGAKSLPGDGTQGGDAQDTDGEAARLRGIHLHRLLEHLPLHPGLPDEGVASDLLTGGPEGADPAAIPALARAARAVLDAPALAHLFAPGTLAEVDVAGEVPGLGPMFGTIDRLVIGDRILAVDYKSNIAVPSGPEDVPEGLLRQLGAYAALLAPAFPDRPVDLAILWTQGPVLMPVPAALAAAALARAA